MEGTDLKQSPSPPATSMLAGERAMGPQRTALESAREQADAEEALRELRGGARIAFILEVGIATMEHNHRLESQLESVHSGGRYCNHGT